MEDMQMGSYSSHQASLTPGKNIRLTYGYDPQQFGDLYIPDTPGPHPVVILIHGGFWRAPYNLSLMSNLAEDLVRHNLAVWNIEYRRIGDPGGGWPGTLQDVARAADYLATIAPIYNLDLHKILAVGHSAGGHLALWLAGRARLTAKYSSSANSSSPLRLTAAVSQAGAIDLHTAWRLNLGNGAVAELLGGGPDDVPGRYAIANPAALLPLQIPQVLIHGTQDDRVPLRVSQVYQQKALATGDTVHLIELPGADHFALIEAASAAWVTTLGEIRRLLHLV
jgi:acetyl esterase/lipase